MDFLIYTFANPVILRAAIGFVNCKVQQSVSNPVRERSSLTG